MSEEKKNHFIYKKIFPDAKSILNRKEKKIDEIFKDAIFVLDTNSLLAPFNTGKENIEEIRKVYKKLIEEKRLYIPEHVLREFARNRSSKISNLYTNIDNMLSTIPSIKPFEYPILGELDAYKELKENRDLIIDNIKKYKDSLTSIKSGITNWNWSDPVTSMYKNTFTEDIIFTTKLSEEDLIKEYEERLNNDIPPGNKDKSKENNAIGDFVIWKSILELGEEKKSDIIFISNDEKNDWLLKGNKKSISTKFELVDEFYRCSDSNHFISMTFTDFLETQGLEIEIFSDFDKIFGNALKSEQNSTLNSLKELNKVISDFLIMNNDDPNEVIFIEENIEFQFSIFKESYRDEYFGTDKWNYYFDYFFLFSEWLPDIISLNNEIIYQEHRHKRDTRTEQIKLLALCKEFVKKYDEFSIII
ncbi:PIN domain-containing protein [Olleya sp. YS]|uniref:PIN domain-containing protein n=1 Tax=Olleya sp. YS TaxID=3028318 RepID=UPI00243438E4|nr:PIN domain-containing protein [Olleya sp. YS]WGD34129.1 PIN domain-containing protein [Olleya sp. YS]